MEQYVLHAAKTRGRANFGWLDASYSFSFANYYNPDRMNFGALRVLNDDSISGGMGFDTHPHNNMEIITIVLQGGIEHKDSMGHKTVIKPGDVQVMSAGTGITHSEYNHYDDRTTEGLQIWVIPNKKNVKPRYQQKTFNIETQKNRIHTIISPVESETNLWIYQNAWFSLAVFDEKYQGKYTLHNSKNGVYFFIIEGSATIATRKLNRRDAIGVWDTTEINFNIHEDNTKLLFMEVPL